MQIHYCQTCGKLIAPALIDSGQVKVQDEKPVFCLECSPPSAASPRAMRSTPSSGSQRNMRSTPGDGSQRNIRNLPVPARGSSSKGTRAGPLPSQSGPRLRASSDRTASRQNTPLLLIGLAIGGVMVIGLIIMAVTGSTSVKTVTKKKEEVKSAQGSGVATQPAEADRSGEPIGEHRRSGRLLISKDLGRKMPGDPMHTGAQ